MSNIDLWMRDVLASYGIIILIILYVVIWMIQKWPTLRKDTYRAHLLGFEMECAELASPYKEHLFKALQHIASNDEMLRSMGSIRILEIGVKTGANCISARMISPYNSSSFMNTYIRIYVYVYIRGRIRDINS